MLPNFIAHNQLSHAFYRNIYWRKLRYDNYKKCIVENSKEIFAIEERFRGLNDSLSFVVNECLRLTKKIQIIAEDRFKTEIELFNIVIRIQELGGGNSLTGIKLKDRILDNNRNDFCWLNGNTSLIPFFRTAAESLQNLYKSIQPIIRSENKVESDRYRYVNQSLTARKKKIKKVILYQRRVTNKTYKEVVKEKSRFMKELRNDRKAKLRK